MNALLRDWTLVVALPVLLRLCLIGTFPLCEDEAYYWEWSRNLALGYHDQGPGVALAIRLGTALFGDGEFGVRFPAVVLLGGALSFAFFLLHEMYGRRAALQAGLALNVIPLFSLAGIVMTHEAVQAFFWSFALFAFWRALRGARSSSGSNRALAWWIATGACVGLAFDGKYTALLFVPAALLFLLLGEEDRRWLRRPHPYLAALTALAIASPVLCWNHQHGWRSVLQVVSLSHPEQALFQPKYLAQLVLTQLGIVSPILFGLMLWRLGAAWRNGVRGADRRDRFLFLFTAGYALPFYLLALHSRVYPNWPGLGYLTGTLLVAGWAAPHVSAGGFAQSAATRWWRAGLGLAAAISAVLYLQLTLQIFPIPGDRDPAKRFYGWREMAAWADSLAAGYSAQGTPVHLYAKSYQVAALLAFYTPGQPRVYEVKQWDRANQYDYWDDLPRGSDALLVVHRDEPLPAITERSFESVEPIAGAGLEIERHGGVAQRFRAYHCKGYKK